MFKNMKLGSKLAFGFGILLVILGGIAVLSNIMSSNIHSNTELAKNESVVFAGIAREMKFDAVQVQQWLTEISATRAMDGLDDGFDEAENSYQSFMKGWVRFQEMYREENDTEGLRELDELKEAFEDYYEMGKVMGPGLHPWRTGSR